MSNQGQDDRIRPPPNDVDAEAEVLACAMTFENERDLILGIVRPEHFYSEPNKWILKAIVALVDAGAGTDGSSIRAWLEDEGKLQLVGGSSYLGRIFNAIPARADIEQVAERVRDKWRLRQLISTCQQISAEGYSASTIDLQSFLDRSEQAIFDIAASDRSVKSDPVWIDDAIKDRYTNLEATMELQAASRVRTGISIFDDAIVGLESPDLAILAARPGCGKTALALQISANVAKTQGGVLFFSMEMAKPQIVDRAMCQQARVDSRDMNDPRKLKAFTMEQWGKLMEAAEWFRKSPLAIDDESQLSLVSLRAKARRVAAEARKRKTELRLIVVDYLQLMDVDPKAQNREQQVSKNSRGLKALAKDLGVPVLCLSQLSREGTRRGGGGNAKPVLSDLRESGAIEQDADMVMFIHFDGKKPDKSDPDASLFNENDASIIVAKNRKYGIAEFKLRFEKKYARFDAIDKQVDFEREYRETTFTGKFEEDKDFDGD